VLEDVKKIFRESNVVGRFIMVNIAVFLLVNIILLIETLSKSSIFNVIYWLAASSNPGELIFKPWTAITYMFLHEGFWHLIFNMIMLFFAGRIFHDLLGTKRFINVYFLGGFAGLALFVLSYNIFPVFDNALGAPILGASASVMAVFVGIASYTPNYTVFLPLIGPVKLKYIAIFYVVLDFISIRSGVNSGGHIAHLGGAIWGFVWARQLHSGRDIGAWFDSLIGLVLALFQPRKNMRVVQNKQQQSQQKAARKMESDKQSVIDGILDKISKSGYDSLTAAEKEILFKASKD
jgi:membrane associated rhomboid family serine protease